MTAEIIQFVPRPNPERDMIGKYSADYSKLTPEQIALNDPELVELYASSVSIGHPWPGEDKA